MVFLLGGSGTADRRFFDARGIVHRAVPRAELDYARPPDLAAALRDFGATFLVNAAGYTGRPNVDACEDHRADTLDGNAVLPGRVREACEQAGIPWGHVSSGCIFNGARPEGGGFTEEDEPNFTFRSPPCSWYSGCKALGEEILAGAPECFVWRLRIPFNGEDGPRNYLSKLMRYERLLDATNSLSQLDEFVAATWALWERRAPFGTYNVTNPGAITAREAVALIEQAGVCRKAWSFFADEREFMRVAARTPRSNCVLDSSKLARAGVRMTPVAEAVARSLREWRA